MNNNIEVSVIIVNYNTTQLTKQSLLSVERETLRNGYEIIVVDNDSHDRSIELLAGEFPNVNFIFSKTNLGFGRANNLAIAIAKGKYLFLLNSDAYLIEDSISKFFDFMEQPQNADVACCGANLLGEDREATTSYGNLPTLAEAISRLGFALFYKQYYKKHLASGLINNSNEIREVGYITGADMFIRKSVIDETGAFDADFFLYFEETELSFRFRKHNFKSYFLPNTSIIHLEGGSQKSDTRFNFKQIERFAVSRKLYFTKCHGGFYAKSVMLIYAIQAAIFAIGKLNVGYLKIALINLKT